MQTSPVAAINANNIRNKRRMARAVQWAGTGFAAVGIGCVLWGSVLPWATLPIFDLPFALPGLLFLWGGASVGAALWAGGRLGQRRLPWVICLLGLVPIYAGWIAPKQAGQFVRGFILHWEQVIAPTNAKLAQAALPPIEPFDGVKRPNDYIGPGIAWTLWGGVLLSGGGAAFAWGERRTRSCFNCGRAWAAPRTPDVSFCPSCGAFAVPLGPGRCANCRTPLQKGDAFCVACGTAAAPKTILN